MDTHGENSHSQYTLNRSGSHTTYHDPSSNCIRTMILRGHVQTDCGHKIQATCTYRDQNTRSGKTAAHTLFLQIRSGTCRCLYCSRRYPWLNTLRACEPNCCWLRYQTMPRLMDIPAKSSLLQASMYRRSHSVPNIGTGWLGSDNRRGRCNYVGTRMLRDGSYTKQAREVVKSIA